MKKEIMNKIENPIVRRAFKKRKGDFIFNYSEENKTYLAGTSHSDHTVYGDYSERSGHSDCTAGRKKGDGYHVDKTTRYDDYSDYDIWSDFYDNSYSEVNR